MLDVAFIFQWQKVSMLKDEPVQHCSKLPVRASLAETEEL